MRFPNDLYTSGKNVKFKAWVEGAKQAAAGKYND
jgi:hypothetical protein